MKTTGRKLPLLVVLMMLVGMIQPLMPASAYGVSTPEAVVQEEVTAETSPAVEPDVAEATEPDDEGIAPDLDNADVDPGVADPDDPPPFSDEQVEVVVEVGSLRIIRTDANGALLSGACLVLRDMAGVSTSPVCEASGELVFRDVPAGSYTLIETSTPGGVEQAIEQAVVVAPNTMTDVYVSSAPIHVDTPAPTDPGPSPDESVIPTAPDDDAESTPPLATEPIAPPQETVEATEIVAVASPQSSSSIKPTGNTNLACERVPEAVTSLKIKTSSGQDKLQYWDTLQIEGTFAIPDDFGECDYFEIALPIVLTVWESFDLKDGDNVVAKAVPVGSNPAVYRFTLTDFTNINNNVSGFFNFAATFNRDLITWNDSFTFEFSGDFTPDVDVDIEFETGSDGTLDPPLLQPAKDGWEGSDGTNHWINWRVTTGKVSVTGSEPATFTITDHSPAAWSIDCSNTYVRIGSQFWFGQLLDGGSNAKYRPGAAGLTFTCSSEQVSVSGTLTDGQAASLFIRTSNLPANDIYGNSAVVTVNQNQSTVGPVEITIVEAGGGATGDATPVNPQLGAQVCTEGEWFPPVIYVEDANGIAYSDRSATVNGDKVEIRVTARRSINQNWARPLPANWTQDQDDPRYLYFFTEVDYVPCELVVPAVPEITGNFCFEDSYYWPPSIQYGPTTGVAYSGVWVSQGAFEATATLSAGYAWDTDRMPQYWTIDPLNKAVATYYEEYVVNTCEVFPVTPTIELNYCEAGEYFPAAIHFPATMGVGYSDGVIGDGEYSARADLQWGYIWDQANWPAGWTIDPDDPTVAYFAGTYVENLCVPDVPVVPVLPEITANVCESGEYFPPVVTPGVTEGVTYSNVTAVDGVITATATLDDGYAWDPDAMPAGWTIDPENLAVATYEGTYTENLCELVVPAVPEISGNVCVNDSHYWPPTIQIGPDSRVAYSDVMVADGAFRATATLSAGYAWDTDNMPQHWTIDPANKAVAMYYEEFVENPCEVVLPVPNIGLNYCEAGEYFPPAVFFDFTTGVEYFNGYAGDGVFSARAKLLRGYTWDLENWPEGWTIDVDDPTVAHFSGTYTENLCEPVVPVLPTINLNVCTDGEYFPPELIPADTEGVTYSEMSAENGVLKATATLADGYAWNENALPEGWTIDPENLAAATYEGTYEENLCEPVVPVLPAIEANVCESGEYFPPELIPVDTDGVTYSEMSAENGVLKATATLANGYAWNEDALPEGWTIDPENLAVATYEGTYEENLCEPVVPVLPAIEANVCESGEYFPPELIPVDTDGVTYSELSAENGVLKATATLANGYAWNEDALPEGWTIDPENLAVAIYEGTYTENLCDLVTPVLPAIELNVCTNGDYFPPQLIAAETEGVTYSELIAEGGTLTVTATLDDGYAWDGDAMPAGWTIDASNAAVATYQGEYTENLCIQVIPVDPSVVGNVCTGGIYTQPSIDYSDSDMIDYYNPQVDNPATTTTVHISIEAKVQPGYTWSTGVGGNGWEIDPEDNTHAIYNADFDEHPCAASIPLTPFLTGNACVDGAYIPPTVDFGETIGVTYTNELASNGIITATATVVDGFEWDAAAMPMGWTIDPENLAVATFSGTYQEAPCVPVVPELPIVTSAVCTDGVLIDPTVTTVDTEWIDYSIDGAIVTGGTVTVFATLLGGAEWDEALPTGWEIDVANPVVATHVLHLEDIDCIPVVPAIPNIAPAECVDDVVVDPSIQMPDTPGIAYTVEGIPHAGGKVIVTATLESGYAWGDLPSGWVKVSNTTAVFEVTFADITCDPAITPSAPTPSPDLPTKPNLPLPQATPVTPTGVTGLPQTGVGQSSHYVWAGMMFVVLFGLTSVVIRKAGNRI